MVTRELGKQGAGGQPVRSESRKWVRLCGGVCAAGLCRSSAGLHGICWGRSVVLRFWRACGSPVCASPGRK